MSVSLRCRQHPARRRQLRPQKWMLRGRSTAFGGGVFYRAGVEIQDPVPVEPRPVLVAMIDQHSVVTSACRNARPFGHLVDAPEQAAVIVVWRARYSCCRG